MSDPFVSAYTQIEGELELDKWFEMGGKGSGHHGHKGIKGRRGGSAPSKGGGLAKLSAPVGDAGVNGNAAVRGWLDEGLETRRLSPTQYKEENKWETAWEDERANLKAQVAQNLSDASGVTPQEASDFVQQWAHSSNDDDMRSLALQQDAAKEFGLKTSEFTQAKIDVMKEKAAQIELKQELETKFFETSRAGASQSEMVTLASELETQWKEAYPGVEMSSVPIGGLEAMTGSGGSKFESLMESDKQRALMRSMYNETQAELKARGITEVRLYRGVTFDGSPTVKNGDKVGIGTNALESWSVGIDQANTFSATTKQGRYGITFEAIIPAERILSTPATGFGCLTEGEVVVLGGTGGDIANVHTVWNPEGFLP